MPDFSTEAYRSYIALCRELRLEHEWQDYDVQAWTSFFGELVIDRYKAKMPLMRQSHDDEYGTRVTYDTVWLPQLADWLDMLEAYGRDDVFIEAESVGDCWERAWRVSTGFNSIGHGLTREEAAARLAIAVGAVKEPVT